MAKCEICGKQQIYGNKLSITRSHISKRNSRVWQPNVKRIKAVVNGNTQTLHVCAKCLKNGKVTRA